MALVASPVNGGWPLGSSLIADQPSDGRATLPSTGSVAATGCQAGRDTVGMILSANACPLGAPPRNQETDVAGDGVNDVREHARDGQAETDWLPGLLADHLELHHSLAD